jgi:tetratricopeptide (TPR) repeat protein/SAM-dependent methyltransferase
MAFLLPKKARVLDVGGGAGILARHLLEKNEARVSVVDHSADALAFSKDQFQTYQLDLEDSGVTIDQIAQDMLGVSADPDTKSALVATEVLEHLSDEAVERILQCATKFDYALFSVPNDRLGPDEEPQHVRKWTALGFLTLLRRYWPNARVEVVGPDKTPGVGAFLLGVCGFPKKTYTLSVTLPVRDEAADIEATISSFRGVADEIVIGVDPRTEDNTREIVAKYAEKVFTIENPRGPSKCRCEGCAVADELIKPNGVHFSHIRQQCIEQCTSDWIFMTEGHESLKAGQDALLNLGEDAARRGSVIFVWRSGSGQRWIYPWMFKKDTRIGFHRPTHNALGYPDDVLCLKLPQVVTHHFRDHNNAAKRAVQRKAQNRVTLLEDWKTRGSMESLYYLASELREYNPEKARERMEEYMALPAKNGPTRYQVRLQLALDYARNNDGKKAREILIRAFEDDWSRCEHMVWLGDLAAEAEQWDQAIQWYEYAATKIGKPPFSMLWIDEDMYSYLPAQRLAMAYSSVGNRDLALHWAKRVLELLPEDAPAEAVTEAEENVRILEEATP